MIQAGDPKNRNAVAGQPLGDSSLPYTVPAEFRMTRSTKGEAAARKVTTRILKASSSVSFILFRKKYTDSGLDSVERIRLKRKISDQREIYKTLGGTPFLDQRYTIFGEVVSGMETVDKIAAGPTSKADDMDRPLQDARI
jgi:peptidyl-prolyl cis-trans isomerase B (cyclophilin B)